MYIYDVIYHHQLRVRNPSSFQIFDLRCELEKPAYFHSKKINVNAVFFFSRTGNHN